MSDHPKPETERREERLASPGHVNAGDTASSEAAETSAPSLEADADADAPDADLTAEPPAPVAPASPVAAKSSWWAQRATVRTTAIVAATGLVTGAIIGGVIGFTARPAVNTTAEYMEMKHSLEKQLDDTKSELGIANNDLDAANKRITDIADREAALTAGEAKLKADQAALDAQTKQVQSTQFGDGIHLVGTSVTPGVYSISSASDCYYAWMSGTGSDADIIDNNIVSGPAVVTLKAGDVFETSRCGTWTKTG